MKKYFISLSLILCFVMSGKAQKDITEPKNDTASYPYWIQMMQDPGENFFKTQHAFNLYWQNRHKTKGCGWKVFKRWEYMMQTRVNPDGSIPPPDQVFTLIKSSEKNSKTASGNWVNLGPAFIPSPGPAGYEGLGRLNVVAFHPTDPNKIYTGAPSGGFWKSENAGDTWSTTTDDMPTLGVSAIVLDQSNPSKILIGTGDRDAGDAPGLGIFISNDGGNSWSPSQVGMGNVTVSKILQDPSNSMVFLAATSSGIFRSTNGGSSWNLQISENFKDICFKPGNPSIVYAALNADFYRSTDNGISFNEITNGLPSGQQRGTIAVSAANPNYVYILISNNNSGFKGLYRSADAGLTFSERSTTPNILNWECGSGSEGGQGWYDLALACDPVNAEIIYVGGINVFKSVNGGISWSINSHWWGDCNVPAVHADCHYLTFSPVNGKLYACNDGGLWVTGNGGLSWTDRTEGMTIGQIYKLGQSQTLKEKVINGFQDNGTYTYQSNGWQQTGGGDGMECAIDREDDTYIYYSIYNGDIFRQHNASEVQVGGLSINGEDGAWVTPFILGENDSKFMFLGLKNIWRCDDITSNDFNWTKISDNLAGSNGNNLAVLEQSPVDPQILYAARSDNKLFITENALGESPVWNNITSKLPMAKTATSIEASPTDANKVYMTLNKKVYKSLDKGQTWEDITGGLPDINLNTIVCYKNSNEGLYVGSDAGVYYKDAFLPDWILFSEGLPYNGRITELDIFYDNDSVSADVIRASTYGRGLWSSSLYNVMPGAEFQAENTLIPVGCSIDFTDLSSGVPANYSWTFEGGTPAYSTQKDPQNISYGTSGTYFVKLKVGNVSGSDSLTKSNYITVSGSLLPVVDFTANNRVPCSGDIVHFTDLTSNCPITWNWHFNPSNITFLEGTSAASPNPVVLFNQPGSYEVRLEATNNVGSGSVTKTAYILSGGYNLPFLAAFENGISEQYWQVVNPDNEITWDSISVPGVITGTKAVWMNLYHYNSLNTRDQLISPPMDFTNYTDITLNFRHAYAQRGTLKDSLIVKISGDCGQSWTRILATGANGTPETFVTHAPEDDPFYPASSSDWCSGSYGTDCYTIDLSPWAGMKNTKLMFESFNKSGNNLFLSDIQVNGPVGISMTEQEHPGFNIYPNPSDGLFTLDIHSAISTATLAIFNPQGMKVYSESIINDGKENHKLLDLRKFPVGIYLILFSTSGDHQIKKIIIE